MLFVKFIFKLQRNATYTEIINYLVFFLALLAFFISIFNLIINFNIYNLFINIISMLVFLLIIFLTRYNEIRAYRIFTGKSKSYETESLAEDTDNYKDFKDTDMINTKKSFNLIDELFHKPVSKDFYEKMNYYLFLLWLPFSNISTIYQMTSNGMPIINFIPYCILNLAFGIFVFRFKVVISFIKNICTRINRK